MATQGSLLAAVGIGCLTVGYWLGMGRSLLAYSSDVQRRAAAHSHSHSDSDSHSESGDQHMEQQDDDDEEEEEEECKMVLLVRIDLKMEKGKIAAQCAHATLAAYKMARRHTPQLLSQWERRGQAKVALKCPDEPTMLDIQAKASNLGIAARSIIDAGRTQIAPNTRTVLAIGPAPKSLVDQITGHLKLL